MKRNIIYTLLLAGLMGSFLSCNEMDLFPQDQLGPGNFWKTKTDIDMGLAGVYSKLKGGYIDWNRYWFDGLTDNGFCRHDSQSPLRNMQYGYLENTTGGPIKDVFGGCYKGIAACNNFMKNFPDAKSNAKLTDTEANSYEAEVRFLRAMFYFELVQHYKDVPLYKEAIESVESSKIKQSKESEVLSFIHEDLDFAISNLPDAAYNTGHAVKISAQAFKARVLLYQEDWSGVEKYAKEVISANKCALAQDLTSIFIKKGGLTGEGQLNNSEIIFSVTYLAPDVYQESGSETQFYSWSALTPTENLMKIYSENDKRFKEWYYYSGVGVREWTNPFGDVVSVTDATFTGWMLLKHFDKYHKENYNFSDTNFRTDNDVIILRYADVLLMYIEAMVEQEGGTTSDPDAIAYMNAIRERAGIDKVGSSVSRDELRLERRKELAFEGLRYFDITRWKIAEDVMNGFAPTPDGATCKFEKRFYMWPFPLSETDVNPNLDQKEGY